MKKRKKPGLKFGSRQTPSQKPITLAPSPWDMGADGPANQKGLKIEPATDIDPETGRETANPNGVIRRRRMNEVEYLLDIGVIEPRHAVTAKTLVEMFSGLIPGGGDPLAAIKVDGGGSGDGFADAIDRKKPFFEAWGKIPDSLKPYVQRVVLLDEPSEAVFGRKMCDFMEGCAKIRVALNLVSGEG